MTIQYQSGLTKEGLVLSRNELTIRVVLEGSDDVMEISNVDGTWVTEDCEPVQIAMAWQTARTLPPVSEADCICPPELAARLIHLLYTGDAEEEQNDAASAAPEAVSASNALM